MKYLWFLIGVFRDWVIRGGGKPNVPVVVTHHGDDELTQSADNDPETVSWRRSMESALQALVDRTGGNRLLSGFSSGYG